jgi:acetyl esterase
MPLEPQVQVLVDAMAALPPVDFDTLDPVAVRQGMALLFAAGDAPVVPVTDTVVPGPAGDVPVRVYDPTGSDPGGPTVVWYHGGGFVVGDLDTTDGTCRRLSAASGMRVVSVDYRLAPEHPFPAAVDDAAAAFSAVVEGKLGGPPSWVAVAGDSAGGNLAAVVSRLAREGGGRLPDFQLLVYPVTDPAHVSESRLANGEGLVLSRAMMEWFEAKYAPGRLSDPRVSPLLASSLAGLPPAYVVTAEYDPLRDEGEAYARRLADAGVPVETVRYDGQVHGFFGTPASFGPTAQRAVEAAALALRSAAGRGQ